MKDMSKFSGQLFTNDKDLTETGTILASVINKTNKELKELKKKYEKT